MALGTGYGVHKACCPFLQACRTVFRCEVGDIVDNAVESAQVSGVFRIFDACKIASVEDGIHGLFADVLHRIVECKVVVLAHQFQFAVDIIGGRVFAKYLDGTVLNAFFRIRNQLGHVDLCHLAKAVAVRAGSVRGIK